MGHPKPLQIHLYPIHGYNTDWRLSSDRPHPMLDQESQSGRSEAQRVHYPSYQTFSVPRRLGGEELLSAFGPPLAALETQEPSASRGISRTSGVILHFTSQFSIITIHTSQTNQIQIPQHLMSDETRLVVSSSSPNRQAGDLPDVSSTLEPSITHAFDPHSPSPPCRCARGSRYPTTIVIFQAAPQLWSSKTVPFLVLVVIAFLSLAFVEVTPINASAASAFSDFGDVGGDVANVHNPLGHSIGMATQISAGIADGAGDASRVAASKLEATDNRETISRAQTRPRKTRVSFVETKLVESLREMSMLKFDPTG